MKKNNLSAELLLIVFIQSFNDLIHQYTNILINHLAKGETAQGLELAYQIDDDLKQLFEDIEAIQTKLNF
ncbi:hypothetical protein MMG00_14005 [Ignatzschineria rhizosphaerae]|uniref:Uncharacterized protein n=1 Tax=Ignatzschineria rhizosphaerae TaxID=2923279 RepID=A0ABY3X672_9GAMM|nr:hypothetical protein [Ignatzschineria rhizosphaerae]UNM96285.1 hypothetical protein MMG00_14005 [Ignatzschineria rhizosphaerae]